MKKLKDFKDKLYVRVSFKAAVPEGFTQRTGALGQCYELPFKALEYLLEEGIKTRAAALTDPGVMPREERDILLKLRYIFLFKCTHEGTLIRWEGKRVRNVTRIGRFCSLEPRGTPRTKKRYVTNGLVREDTIKKKKH